eukprot:TRINITY_DN31949_c0_g1_i1.p1 TRINITY_DN31949_c0_g1~~TRINITY_DN31949_c0_g1_i1.p1  ORF type:complete len:193 (+),score=26.00 TRINITY_DN31949_c0_g1_i1:69-647(+)
MDRREKIYVGKSITSLYHYPQYMVAMTDRLFAIQSMSSFLLKVEINLLSSDSGPSPILGRYCFDSPIADDLHKVDDHRLLIILLSLEVVLFDFQKFEPLSIILLPIRTFTSQLETHIDYKTGALVVVGDRSYSVSPQSGNLQIHELSDRTDEKVMNTGMKYLRYPFILGISSTSERSYICLLYTSPSPRDQA